MLPLIYPFLSTHHNDETQRGLSVSTSKECGVDGPAFLTYFLCSAVRNQREQNNTCQNPPPQLSKIIFVTGSTDSNYLVCVKLGATKPPNKTSGEAFAARFCTSCCALKLLKRPSNAGYGYFCMQRVTEKVSLFGSMNLSRQSYRQSLR